MFSAVAASGSPISELADPLAYMLHATTDEGKKAMVEAAIERGTLQPGMGWSDFMQLRDTGDMTRKLRMTAVEANELAAQGKLSITGGRKVGKFFNTNPLIAQVMRETAAAQSMGTASHLRELAATFGRPVEAAAKTPGTAIVLASVYENERRLNDLYIQETVGKLKTRTSRQQKPRTEGYHQGFEYGGGIGLQRQVRG
jgi:hypothetical protein